MNYQKTNNCIEERSDDILIIYNPTTDKTHILNETATWLWDNMPSEYFCDDCLINKLISVITDLEYDVESVCRECKDCLAMLCSEGLIHNVDDG